MCLVPVYCTVQAMSDAAMAPNSSGSSRGLCITHYKSSNTNLQSTPAFRLSLGTLSLPPSIQYLFISAVLIFLGVSLTESAGLLVLPPVVFRSFAILFVVTYCISVRVSTVLIFCCYILYLCTRNYSIYLLLLHTVSLYV